MKKRRIFWLGMHVVLTRTELPRLRQLGFEVYNPPYNSDVYDQSANLNWDRDQETTLPPEVFAELSAYNFFYNKVTPRIGKLLNTYFDAVVVTINPDWLASIMEVYHGPVIYRTYGQTFSLSTELIQRRLWKNIVTRDNFFVVPFAPETIDTEHQWLRDRCSIVPYHLPLEVFPLADTWDRFEHSREILVSVPNIVNPYYAGQYNHISVNFPEPYLRIIGVQPKPINDPRVAGILSRQTLLESFQRAAGYFYPYHDYNVCYLPPIEMMTIGGPVVYAPNSLLTRFYKGRMPGLATGIDEQKKKMRWLLEGDQAFIQDVIDSQEPVRRLYHPDHVLPIFDEVFTRLLNLEPVSAQPRVLEASGSLISTAPPTPASGSSKKPRGEVWILFHFPGDIVRHDKGRVFASEGIPRVVDKVVDGLVAHTDLDVVITCNARNAPAMAELFGDGIAAGRVSLHLLQAETLDPEPSADARKPMRLDLPDLLKLTSGMIRVHTGQQSADDAAWSNSLAQRLQVAQTINARDSVKAVFVPHYYLFPEAGMIERDIVLYLPDYTPHFFPGVAFDATEQRDADNAQVGRHLADQAKLIMTNSQFTRNYLADTVLEADIGKVRVLPMPLLVGKASTIHPADRRDVEYQLGGWPYMFYPTANRPNKQIAFLLRVFHEARKTLPELRLVLTCSLHDYPMAEEIRQQLGLTSELVFFPGVSEGMIRWLYEHAALMCMTTTMEGNFPPQIIEALHYRTPVVATRLPHIVEVLGDDAESLLLCQPMSLPDFTDKVQRALTHREDVVARQAIARERVLGSNSPAMFGTKLRAMFEELDLVAVP